MALQAFVEWFDTSGFPPRWHCGDWSPALGWTHIISDVLIFLAYVAIPIVIMWYVRRRPEVPFPAVFWLFCAFIFSCGTTHLIEAVIFWHPIYPFAAVVKAITAVVSLVTAAMTIRIMPHALALPALSTMNQQLRGEIAARAASEAHLAESERRLVAAQAAAKVGDWTYDLTTRRMEWSDQVYRLFDRDPALGPPSTPADHAALYLPGSRDARNETLKRALEQPFNAAGIDLEARLPDGSTAWHHSTITVERDANGKPSRLWGTVQDITAQKLTQLADARQRRELERINQQLEQFAYIASHDLTEPLRKVRFFADVVTQECVDVPLTPAAKDALQRVTSASERMHRLVQDLLNFARAGKSLTQPRPVSLDAALNEVIDTLDQMAKNTGAIIEREPLPEVMGDYGLLTQVLQNLLTNAMKYRHPDRPLRIRVSAERTADQVAISICDNGLGFQADQATRLFEPFVRLHRQSGQEGTGIGLAICRRIVEAHGGTIVARPNPDQGSTFTLTLPTNPIRSRS